MELGDQDLQSLMNSMQEDDEFELEEDHVITILYNTLCGLNFLHSANLIHRDIKSANLLMNQECGIMFCDFGLARALPKKSETETLLTATKKESSIYSGKIEERINFKSRMAELLNTHKEDRKN